MKKKKIKPREGWEPLLYNLPKLTKKQRGVVCLDCGWCGVSYSVHDYKTCRCPNQAMVAGGLDYICCGAKDMSRIQFFEFVPKKLVSE